MTHLSSKFTVVVNENFWSSYFETKAYEIKFMAEKIPKIIASGPYWGNKKSKSFLSLKPLTSKDIKSMKKSVILTYFSQKSYCICLDQNRMG